SSYLSQVLLGKETTQEIWDKKINKDGEPDEKNGKTRLDIMRGWAGWQDQGAAITGFYEALPVSYAVARSESARKEYDLETLGGHLGIMADQHFPNDRAAAAAVLGLSPDGFSKIVNGRPTTQEFWDERVGGADESQGLSRLKIVQGWKGWEDHDIAF